MLNQFINGQQPSVGEPYWIFNNILLIAFCSVFRQVKKMSNLCWKIHCGLVIELIQQRARHQFETLNTEARRNGEENSRSSVNASLAIIRSINNQP